ncbi:ACT domain-containing protein ACR4-like isoform X1 [Carex rostrata]
MDVDFSPTWDSDDEYEKFIQKMNPPRVIIDNESYPNATVVKVDSANKNGILLDVVQVLTDLNLVISKAYITSDGGWFMDVFNVTDQGGKKIKDEAILSSITDCIRKSLGADSCYIPSRRQSVGIAPATNYTSIELTGTDRPGLLSDVSAVLADLNCNVVNAEIWTHNTRAAAVIHVTDEQAALPITDPDRVSKIKERLSNLLKGSGHDLSRGPRTSVSMCTTHTERRLHQMMFDDRDYVKPDDVASGMNARPHVTLRNWHDKDYSVVTIRCKDRPKLLFDTVCTLTDMKYVVFHASVDAEGPEAFQEFYIRHIDGSPVNSEAEKERVIQCLKAAIERRVSEGLKLELCTEDKVGLLSEVTRIFREHGLTVTRAEVTTRGDKAVNIFYVRDTNGNPVDPKMIDRVREAIGFTVLQVKGQIEQPKSPQESSPTQFLLSSLFRARTLCHFGLIRP